MIDIRRLLSDPQYKKYFMTAPRLPAVARALGDPYYVYIQRENHGPWTRGRAANYKEAYETLRRQLPNSHDVVIVSRRVAFNPPTHIVKVVKNGKPVMVDAHDPQTRKIIKVQKTAIVTWTGKHLLDLEGGDLPHTWCCYCRRPTEFRYFPRHHAFKNATAYDMTRLRCTVCGASQELVKNGARI